MVLPVPTSNPQLLDERPHPGQRADLNVRTTGFRVRRRQTLTSTFSQLLLGPPNEWALQRTCGGRRRYPSTIAVVALRSRRPGRLGGFGFLAISLPANTRTSFATIASVVFSVRRQLDIGESRLVRVQ